MTLACKCIVKYNQGSDRVTLIRYLDVNCQYTGFVFTQFAPGFSKQNVCEKYYRVPSVQVSVSFGRYILLQMTGGYSQTKETNIHQQHQHHQH